MHVAKCIRCIWQRNFSSRASFRGDCETSGREIYERDARNTLRSWRNEIAERKTRVDAQVSVLKIRSVLMPRIEWSMADVSRASGDKLSVAVISRPPFLRRGFCGREIPQFFDRYGKLKKILAPSEKKLLRLHFGVAGNERCLIFQDAERAEQKKKCKEANRNMYRVHF